MITAPDVPAHGLAALLACINVKLALLGFPPVATAEAAGFNDAVAGLIAHYREQERLLANHLCPADQRIQTFFHDYFQETSVSKLPLRTLVLDRPGMARLLSLPVDRDEFMSEIISSYRVKQGLWHNPRSDRRTTQGVLRGGRRLADSRG